MNENKKVLLYSGGMDSWLIDKLWKPDVKLFIDTGTKSCKEERKKLPDDVIVHELDISKFELEDKNFLLPLRNLFFVELASYYGNTICLGATGTSTHFDKTEEFCRMSEEVINYLFSEVFPEKKVKIVMPYKNKFKTEMLKEYLDNGGDINEAWENTFSCYSPVENKMCGKCSSCLKRIEAFKNNGFGYEE